MSELKTFRFGSHLETDAQVLVHIKEVRLILSFDLIVDFKIHKQHLEFLHGLL